MEFKDIATVSGKGGLFKILSPTRSGVILESMDESKTKLIVNANSKVSILHEISIYTTDAEGTIALEEVLRKIHAEFKGDTGLDKNSSNEELKALLKHVLPVYDAERVYVSDIRKLVAWYAILVKVAPEVLAQAEPATEEKKPKDKKATKEKSAEAPEPEAAPKAKKPATKKKSAEK